MTTTQGFITKAKPEPCPQCGGLVTYEGTFKVECATYGCANYFKGRVAMASLGRFSVKNINMGILYYVYEMGRVSGEMPAQHVGQVYPGWFFDPNGKRLHLHEAQISIWSSDHLFAKFFNSEWTNFDQLGSYEIQVAV